MITIRNAIPRMPELRFQTPVNWNMEPSQHWAITGPNGAGKTIFIDILTGKIPLKDGEVRYKNGCTQENIKTITFRDIYDTADYKNMYYQQRWNSAETANVPRVEDLLSGCNAPNYLNELLHLFHVEDILRKQLILLSSGELRKFLIIRTLLSRPAVLILDNPYIGLDEPSRKLLDELLRQMVRIRRLQVITVVSDPGDIPDITTHVLPIFDRQQEQASTPNVFLNNNRLLEKIFPSQPQPVVLPENKHPAPDYQYALKMENIHIRYGDRIILNHLHWEVKRGEKWALSGPNGSGKSTLLSLVCADNPQSYANTFCLFDRPRGSGESIWEIKKRIGYISPEIHLYYLEDVPAIQVVASGFFDSVGLHRKCNEAQQSVARQWMEVFGIAHLQSRSFLRLSYGEQRLALLARAFVKHPELLILDEPLHGLDRSNKLKAGRIIEQFCLSPDKTLIYVTHYPQEIPSIVNRHFFAEGKKSLENLHGKN
jgi:molybdate transport system ATP-binding protein